MNDTKSCFCVLKHLENFIMGPLPHYATMILLVCNSRGIQRMLKLCLRHLRSIISMYEPIIIIIQSLFDLFFPSCLQALS